MYALGTTDLLVLAAIVAAPVVIGLLGRSAVQTSDDLLLANRSLPWWLVGSSLALAGLAPAVYVAGPNEAYHAGLKLLLIPLLFWAALPIVFRFTVPLLYNLELDSIFEYVELRFGSAVRCATAGLYLVGQLLWLAGLLALAVTLLPLGANPGAKAAMVAALAAIATACACCGGLKAVTSSHGVQLALLVAGLLLVAYVVGSSFERGPPRIWEVAHRMGRTRLIDAQLDWHSKWTIWAAAPFCVLTAAYFFLADQATLQRLVAAHRQRDMTLGYLLAAVMLGFLIPLAAYVGMGLLAFYQEHAQQEMAPEWVANIAPDVPTGRPRDWRELVIDQDSIEQLVAASVLLDPNTGRPFQQAQQLLGPNGEVLIDRLATRLPPRLGGERLLRRGQDQLLARFVARHLRWGAAGMVAAALAGAVVAALSAGLIAMSTVILVDFHRRFGWAEKWLAARQGKSPQQLDQTDELTLLRIVMLALGMAVGILGIAIATFGHPMRFLLGTLAITASPLLGTMILGLFSRRASGPAAMLAVACGSTVAFVAAVGHHLTAIPLLGAIWPLAGPIGPFWPFLFGVLTSVASGYAGSFLLGRPEPGDQLAGLVCGLGRLGVLKQIPREAPPQAAGEAQRGQENTHANEEQLIWLDWPPDDRPGRPKQPP